MLERIKIVLMNPSHPGNIGSAARAMKTMGLSQLCLVEPAQFPHPKALELAANAKDIIETAEVVNTLDEAIADCTLVVGTSARLRTIPWPLVNPRKLAETISQESATSQTAILFGCEQSGLTNEALHRCQLHVQIPANPAYSSLNLAAAVQIIAYELWVASTSSVESETWDYRFATADEMEKFFLHLEQVLIAIQFLNPDIPRQLMTRLRRLFLRARPDVMEMNILRGMLSAIDAKIK